MEGETHGGWGGSHLKPRECSALGEMFPPVPLLWPVCEFHGLCLAWETRFGFEERVSPGPAPVTEAHRLHLLTSPPSGLCPGPLSWEVTSLGRIRGPQHCRAIRSPSSTLISLGSVQFSSVTQSCPTRCDPMDCSMPGHHQPPELA